MVDGVYNSELMAPYDVLQHTVFHARPGIEVFTVSPGGQPVTTFEGIRITPAYSFQNAPPIDILVVPSARGSMDRDLKDTALINWVRQVGGRARHVVSLCDGAFVLAQAGLLDGVPATTFPDDYKRLAQMFPRIDLRINVSFVDAGKVLTSEGGARSYDVAMHLVDKLYGPKVAQGVGHGLLIPWPPAPGTLKFDTAVPSGAATDRGDAGSHTGAVEKKGTKGTAETAGTEGGDLSPPFVSQAGLTGSGPSRRGGRSAGSAARWTRRTAPNWRCAPAAACRTRWPG